MLQNRRENKRKENTQFPVLTKIEILRAEHTLEHLRLG